MNNIEVTPENVFEVLNRLVEKEQITFDLAINEAKRATDEIFGRLYGGDKLDLQELRKLLSLAVQYEHQLFHWLDSPIHFYYQKHKEYPLRIKEFRLKCIADLQTAQKVIESKLEWKKEEKPAKQSKTLRYFFVEPISDNFIEYVKSIVNGKKGKDLGTITTALTEVKALINLESNETPFFKSLQKEAGALGSRQAWLKYHCIYTDLSNKPNSTIQKSTVDDYISRLKSRM